MAARDGWPSPDVFQLLQAGDVERMWGCRPGKLRPFLPYLVRMALSPASLLPSHSHTGTCARDRKLVLSMIAAIPEANLVNSYLQMDFPELKSDAVKERQLLRKLGPAEERPATQSVLATSMQFGMAIEFERSDHMRRMRLFLSEILRVMSKVDSQFAVEQSDLFESEVHLAEICDIMAIAVEELPTLLPVVPVTEALLRLRNGPRLLTCLVANMPDQLDQVLTSLLVNGETQDEVSLAGRCRTTALSSLLHLHPPSSPHIQSLSLLHHKHPTLALSIALSAEENPTMSSSGSDSGTGMGPEQAPPPTPTGVVTLLHNIIITGDQDTKAWFSQYMKLMQQKYRRQRTSAVTRLRKFIMRTLLSFTARSHSSTKPSETNEVFVAMETDTAVVRERDSTSGGRRRRREVEVRDKPGKSVSGVGGEGGKEKKGVGEGGEGDGGETTEGDSEIEMDTALELVDQMDIEVSDGDGEPSPKVAAVVSEGGGGGGGGGGEKGEGGRGLPKSALATEVVRASGKGEGGQRSRSRRRHSSGVPAVEFSAISEERQLSDKQAVELMSLLHVCCGLKMQSQMYLTTEETSVILSLIVCSCPPFSPAGVHFIQITLAMLLACPFLIGGSLECEKATEHWLQWLLNKLPEFDRSCSEGGSYGEMLLLIAIHLREKQLPQLEELTSNILRMKVTGSRSNRFSHLRQIFLKVFTEEVVCLHAVSVSPTSNLSASLSGYLPVHCVHQLLKTKTFRKHSISITDWVYRQLLHLAEPLHPTLPPLIVEFVNSILLPSSSHGRAFTPGSAQGQGSSSACHTPFSAEEVLRVYRHDDELPSTPCSMASQLMILFYILIYQDTYQSNLKTLLFQSTNTTSSSSSPRPYSPAILAQIPVKQLLLYAGQNHAHYSSLYPSLLRLTATHLPQLCLVEDWLKGEEQGDKVGNQFSPLLRLPRSQLTPAMAETVLSQLHSSPSRALVLLSHLTSLPPPSLPPYCHTLSSTLPLLLSPSVTRRVQEAYLCLWTKLNLVVPRRLWLETVGALRPRSQQHLAPPTHAQLTEDPFTVLQCDPRVFRCPPVLEMLLRVLVAYSSASRAWLLEKCHAQNCITVATSGSSDSSVSSSGRLSVQERKELCVALTAAQESAMIQLLLEMCLPDSREEEKECQEVSLGSHFSVLREVQCLICSYLHQVFIAEPEMVKLVHFQGYPEALLPVVVAHVPSMHICLKFIPELVTQPQTDKQQFGVLLASHVVQQYPLPEALSIVDDIIKRLLTLANEIPSRLREDYFTPLLPALVRFCQSFPPLCAKVTQLLVELSRAAGDSGDSLSVSDTGGSGGGGKRGRSTEGRGFVSLVRDTFQELVETAVLQV